jgi:hypothetical protein
MDRITLATHLDKFFTLLVATKPQTPQEEDAVEWTIDDTKELLLEYCTDHDVPIAELMEYWLDVVEAHG